MDGIEENKPQAVFFDWDGTLVDSIPFLFKAHNHVRERLNVEPWDMPTYKENIKHSSLALYKKIYRDRSEEALNMLYEFVHHEHLHHMKVMTMAEELIEYIHSNGVLTGIVSNKRHDVLQKEVAHLGWDHYFDSVVGAGVATRDKPWADPLIHAFELTGHQPHITKTWYVGDSEPDMKASDKAGCAAVLITNGEDKSALIQRFQPYKVVDDCGDLLSSLQDLKKIV